jgi:hypothetical protein
MTGRTHRAIKARRLLRQVFSSVLLVTLAIGPSGLWHGVNAARGSLGPIPQETQGPGDHPEDARSAPSGLSLGVPFDAPLPGGAILNEGFESSVVPPTGWTRVASDVSYSWKLMTVGTPHGGTYAADVEYDPAPAAQNEWLLSPEINACTGTLSFWSEGSVYWCRDDYDNCDLNAWIVIGDPGGGDDIYITEADPTWPGSWTWAQSSVDISSLLPGGPTRIGFQYVGNDGAQVVLDDILLSGTYCNQLYLPLVMRNYDGTAVVLGTPTLLAPSDGATMAKYLFDWTDVANATGYRFQLSPSTSFSPLTVDTAVGSSQYDFTSSLSGTYYWRVYATAGASSGPYSAYRSLTLASYNADDDGDSLRNGWELHGYDYGSNGTIDVDLPAMGANYRHKDLFVEMDYMYRADAANGIAPNANVMNTIVAAFDAFPMSNPDGVPGVDIHLELDDLVPYDYTLDPYASEFAALKSTWFPASRQATHHYMIWANRYGATTSSGVSMGIPASDFLVTLGGWNGGNGGTDEEKIGTFIHELGHNLNLTHGGGSTDHVNYKPNYISIMNYFFQTSGLYRGGTWYNWEYQPFALPALNEASLSEPAGLGSAAPAGYGTAYYCAGGGGPYLVADATGPIDWNCDYDASDTGVYGDVNYDGLVNTLAATTNNYNQILFTGGGVIGSGLAPDALRELARRLSLTFEPVTDELTWEMQQKIDQMMHRSPPVVETPLADNR